MKILEIRDLNKSYGRIKALSNLSMTIGQGEVLGILGPNGSGKTTTLGIILSVLRADSGSFTWFEDTEGKYHRKRIGAVLETPNFYPFLNADQNLKIVAEIKGVKSYDADWILEKVGLLGRRTSKFNTYSLGMKQRLAIGATLIGNPEVLIFDEPTNGLDPQGIAEVRSVIKTLSQENKTIIMASHILDEVEKICSHVAILKNGKLLAHGPVGSILSNDLFAELAADDMDALQEVLANEQAFKNIVRKARHIECQIENTMIASDVNKLLFEKGITLSYLNVRSRKLEEEFIAITSKSN
jgi:ABC-type multidrug transport system ATPase subunit